MDITNNCSLKKWSRFVSNILNVTTTENAAEKTSRFVFNILNVAAPKMCKLVFYLVNVTGQKMWPKRCLDLCTTS